MTKGIFRIPLPKNEPVLSYSPNSEERLLLNHKIQDLKSQTIEIPLIIGGKEVKTGNIESCVIPHNHQHIIAHYHVAGKKEINMAIEAAKKAKKSWSSLPWQHRAAIFLKAADLISGNWRYTLNAATMLGQSKTAHQAEIDSACEFADFLRFNVDYANKIYGEQPLSAKGEWNRLEYRPLDGFVVAISPFNFTAIGGNLPTAPALMGNTVLWKPAATAVYSNYFIMKLLQEAGLPDGVINFIPCLGHDISDVAIKHKDFSAIHFTGSTQVFNIIWKNIANEVDNYTSYPRLVGETGGKDFIFAHESCDSSILTTALIRGAFEYQGQKCSAASRAYIPRSIYNEIKNDLVSLTSEIKVGDVEDYTNFMGAVIDKKAFDKITSYIEYANESDDAEIICGGEYDSSVGFFIRPTIIVTSNPKFKSMQEEIFGPVLTIFVYENNDFEKTLTLCDETSPYALTGAIFAKDRYVIAMMEEALSQSAGNFYINDKPTGAVVGQQPFGGSRKSGTNDKAGSMYNLLRFVSLRNIKENFNAPKEYKYDFMQD